VIALDVDGPEGVLSLAALEAVHGPLPPTLRQRTGSGGYHYFFQHPGGGRRVKNSVRALGPGLDVRGDGGYVVIAPATHWSGGVYEWLPGCDTVADAPEWFLEMVCERPAGPRAAPAATQGASPEIPRAAPAATQGASPYLEAALKGEAAAVLNTPTDCGRNNQLNKSAFSLGTLVDAGLPESVIRQALTSVALASGLGVAETEATLNSGLAAGMAAPRTVPDGRVRKARGTAETPHDPVTGEVIEDEINTETGESLKTASVKSTTVRPSVRLVGGNLPSIVDEAEISLVNGTNRLYQRNGCIVKPAWEKIKVVNYEDKAAPMKSVCAPRISTVDKWAVVEEFTRFVDFQKYRERTEDWGSTNCPDTIASVYMSRNGEWKLRELTGMIHAPTLRPDSSILEKEGYDQETGLLLDFIGAKFKPISSNPSRDEAIAAVGVLKRAIKDFPFVGPVDLSVALSGFLTVLIRRSLPTAPLHGFTAPTAGSGKSYLADMASIIATGRQVAVISQENNPEEFEKCLGSSMLSGDQIISIDNCQYPLGTAKLYQALTQTVLSIRILGKSENPPIMCNSSFFATGNNLSFLGDMTRRALICHLDPKCERPELRRFDCDALAYTYANRAEMVVAALTILRAYAVAGYPSQEVPLGSFERWSMVVRSALVWIGEADPVSSMDAGRNSDPELESITHVLTAWDRVIGEEPVMVRDVIGRASSDPDLLDALLSVSGDRGQINSKKLGKWLTKTKNRIVDNKRLITTSCKHNTLVWQVVGGVWGFRGISPNPNGNFAEQSKNIDVHDMVCENTYNSWNQTPENHKPPRPIVEHDGEEVGPADLGWTPEKSGF
jgi:hypothetical protein